VRRNAHTETTSWGSHMSNRLKPSRPKARSFRLAACLLALPLTGISAAKADDMPMPTKAPPAPVYNWTGCYAGANVGGGSSGTNFRSTVDPGAYLGAADAATVSADGSGSRNDDRIPAGGQLGCNWQTGTLVLGIEGDFDYFHSNPNINNNTAATGISLANGSPVTIIQSLVTNYLATVRPRVGIAADRNFAYITGGVAFTSISYTETYSDANPAPGPGAGAASASHSLVGWTAGAGWEYAFADHWTVRAEYLIAGFPTTNALGTIVALGGTNTLHGSADLTIQLVRAGVNFKF
jgi:outer membrane immunogenic protein